MSKQTRKQKKEEERRLIEEWEAALAEERGETPQETPSAEEANEQPVEKEKKRGKEDFYSSTQPQTVHCPRCKTQLKENGECPTCGYKMYVPMSEEQRKKIRTALTVVGIGIFLVLFILLQFR